MPPKKQDDQALPTKEQALFRQLIKQYEMKMYKKGIKTADAILRRLPHNGETLAMKGLLLNCLDRKAEAYELVKAGVTANLRSHVCWHVYGLLYRSDRNYDEAIKCYKNSLRLDKDNITVLRDLAQLQIQMRDAEGFLDTRQTLLELKPTQGAHWVSLALAHHLCGNHAVAATVLDAYETTSGAGAEPYEHSEILLYKISILEQGGNAKEAMAALDAAESRGLVRDKIGAMEMRARMLTNLGRAADAEAMYRKLLALNSESYAYHRGLLEAKGLLTMAGESSSNVPSSTARSTNTSSEKYNAASDMSFAASLSDASAETLASLILLYAELQRDFPQSTVARRIPLDFLRGDAFLAAADAFVRPYLARGIPSLFAELKPLYVSSAKAFALGTLLASIESSLQATGNFPPLTATRSGSSTRTTNSDGMPFDPAVASIVPGPETLLWTRLCLAQHHDTLGFAVEAISLVDVCLQQDPKLIEAHSIRAKALKHAGDLVAAAAAAHAARELDLSDRYLNSVAVKASFKAGRTDEAERTTTVFTRETGAFGNSLLDMQATWYEVASGRAYAEAGRLGLALKRFRQVDAHFEDFAEDQFDFHQYCVRKQTMRAYVDMLRMEDALLRHPTFAKAVVGAAKAYIRLADAPRRTKEEEDAEAVAGMTPEEAKKYMQKRRKEQAREKKRQETAAAAATTGTAAGKETGKEAGASSGNKGKKDVKKVDPDPEGELLAATPDPLGEATKLLRKLLVAAPDHLEAQLLASEVHRRRGKLLLALAATKRASKIAGSIDHPEVHAAVVRLARAVATRGEGTSSSTPTSDGAEENGTNDTVQNVAHQVLQSGVASLLGDVADVAIFHETWSRTHGQESLLHSFIDAQLRTELHPEQKSASAMALATAGPSPSADGSRHKDCVSVHRWLLTQNEKDAAQVWKAACARAFPFSRYFEGASVVELASAANEDGGAAVGEDAMAANGADVAEGVAAMSLG